MGQYFSFSGESSRSEFWAVMLIITILSSILSAFSIMLLLTGAVDFIIISVVMLIILTIVVTWVMLATSARRCRSADINPWWTAAVLLPYIGFITVIVIGVLPPKEIG